MKQALFPRVLAALASVVITLSIFDHVARMGEAPEATQVQAARAAIAVA